MTVKLYENQVIREASGRNLRLLWLPPGREGIAVIDLNPNGGMPFWMNRLELSSLLNTDEVEALLEDPAAATIRADSDLSDAEKKIRNDRYNAILPLIDDPDRTVLETDLRGAAVAAHIKAHNVAKKYIYAWLSLWWRRGQLRNALVPDYSASARNRKPPKNFDKKRGRPRDGAKYRGLIGINVTPEIADFLAAGRSFIEKGESVSKAFKSTLDLNFSDQVMINGQRLNVNWPDEKLPTREQFVYHVVNKMGRGDALRAVKGETSWARKNRPRLGTARDDAFGPGSHYQIDATIADIFLCSYENRDRIIGRPVLYIVIDVYSRMIVGFTVALSGPSWEIAKLALENAMTDKVAFCAKYNKRITEATWPPRHVCRRLTCDRGRDVSGANAAAAAEGLGFKHARLPPYRPDWKGLVEGRFSFIHEEEIKWAPGSCHGRERGEPKHQLDSAYTLGTFTELMLNFILHYNSRFEVAKPPRGYVSPDGRLPTPLDLWNYGCQAAGAPQVIGQDRVRANLLHAAKARETDKGLYFKGLHYQPTNPEGLKAFSRIPGRHWKSHDIRYDPRDMSTILVSVDRGARFDTFHLTPADREFAGWTEDEARDFRAAQRIGRRLAADERRLLDSQHNANQADLHRRVMAEAEGIKLTRASAVGIRAERAVENRRVRAEGAWTAMPPPPKSPPAYEGTDVPEHAAIEPEPVASASSPPAAAPSRFDSIRAAREAARVRSKEEQ